MGAVASAACGGRMMATEQKIGYIRKNNLELNPDLKEKFKYIEDKFTRKITSRSDRVYSQKFIPLDYEEIVENAKMMKGDGNLILVQKPFLVDDELRKIVLRWVDWANQAEPWQYDPFAKRED
jgi:hypothetical protein